MTSIFADAPVRMPQIDQLLIGKSAAIVQLKEMIRRVAQSSASVMIHGASGVGKEMVARAIHAESQRAGQPIVALNCGAIAPDLIESELFGHERGSFTGATARRTGRFEEAHRGTLFLDEIGDMRFDMQVKLLRVLEDRAVQRVGGTGSTPVDVRVISATHRDIDAAIADNRFREDLYFRLGVVPIHVPNLSERLEDVPLLVAHFLEKLGARKTGAVRFDASGMAALIEHRWPGNVRELRNVVERATILFAGCSIGAGEVRQLIGGRMSKIVPIMQAISVPVPRLDPPPADAALPINLKTLLETMELERIQMALDMADGVISDAARLLTLKRTTLIEKMRKYGVDREC
jgi:sigma-54 specific flagellar transcriptional regulator A